MSPIERQVHGGSDGDGSMSDDGQTVSPWVQRPRFPDAGPLDRTMHADVCVVGAGIAGTMVAWQLLLEGKSVVVLEAGSAGGGETSRTTAHLTHVLDARYHELEHLHGTEGARLAADSHTRAIAEIERLVQELGIDCGFARVDGYLFAPPGDPHDDLERELEACWRAGLERTEWADRAPIPAFETGACLRFPDQAQFHPMAFLAGLLRAFADQGGKLFTGTRVTKVEGGRDGQMGRVGTGDGGYYVTASEIVVATDTPVNDLVTMHTKQYPYRTYAIAVAVPPGAVAPALCWDTADPYHYARTSRDGARELLIVGGEDHRTGRPDDTDDRFDALLRWTRERWPEAGEVAYRWSGQVIEPVDALAFIGRNPGDENVWIATGTSGNGMTYGAITGLLVRDLVMERDHPWARIYAPSRKSLRTAVRFARENLNVVAQYAARFTGGDVRDETEIRPGEGAIVRHGLRKLAVYCDDRGVLHRCSAVCPHLKAIVSWNPEEHTWDCPAHGSRFDPYGSVLNGPAISGLEREDAPEPEREPAPGPGDAPPQPRSA